MPDKGPVRIILQHSHTTTYYTEQETIAACQIEVQVLQQLCDAGVIQGIEDVGGERRYSTEDIVQLRRAHRLQHDLGVNVEGIEVILHLLRRVESLQHELEGYRSVQKD
ncbi:MAG: MerR family transcriptional regulator [Chloroflexi bacterium]|nr:MAG: MerR family transcriptional regulator [Chloroflexota bacterium]